MLKEILKETPTGQLQNQELLIIPGFATDLFGFLLLFPLTRKLFFGKMIKNFKSETKIKKPYIEGEFEDIEEDDERKL